jgi:hypothetical protein
MDFLFRCRDTTDCGEIHTVVDSIGVTELSYVGFGTYEIQGAVIQGRTYGTLSAVNENNTPAAGYRLSQNYPNPFNPSTVIRYQLPVVSEVRLQIFDVLGREVAALVKEHQEAGYHQAVFRAEGLASGVYFSRLTVLPALAPDLSQTGQTGSFTETKRLVLLK